MEKEIKVDMGCEGRRSVTVDLPSNSHNRRREEKVEQTRVKKVVTGTVKKRKKTLTKRFLDTFIADDINDVSSYIIYDVIIPAVKGTIIDMVQGGIERLFLGEGRGNRNRRDYGRPSYVSYDKYSSRDKRDDRRNNSPINRNPHSFDDIVIQTRGEAEEVLSHLVDLTIDYGQATVSDFYELVGVREEYPNRRYGWTNLRSASVSRLREGGYVLNLPKPIVVD